MAIPADAVWELRNTVGSINNGGGFSMSLAGTTGIDYSQQASPQWTNTDGAGSAGTTFTSTGATFDNTILGNCIHINGQGDYFVTAFLTSNTVTVDRALGTFSGATYAVGGCRQLSAALGTVLPSQVAGNKIWVRVDGTYGFQFAPVAQGTSSNYVVIEGYGTVRGDNQRPTVKCTTPALLQEPYVAMKNFVLDGNNANVKTVYMRFDGTSLINCVVQNPGADNAIYVEAGGTILIDSCKVISQAGGNHDVCILNDSAEVRNTMFIGGGTTNWNSVTVQSGVFHRFDHCVFTGGAGTGCGFQINTANNSPSVVCDGCAFWNNNASGFVNFSGNPSGAVLRNCIFGKNGAYDINNAGSSDYSTNPGALEWAKIGMVNNFFYTTGTGRYNRHPASTSDLALPADPFVDGTTTLNFKLNTGAGGNFVINNLLVPAWADGVNTGHFVGGPIGATIVQATQTVASAVAGVAPTIDEVQFPTGIGEGAIGGPTFSTIVIVAGNGLEQRVPLFSHGRYQWNAATGLKSPSDMAVITAFWLARQGRARGFRWKDWDDYQVTNQALTPDGSPTIQLIKSYSSGTVVYNRVIYKPQTNLVPVTIMRNGSSYAAWVLDTTTGIITWTPINQKAVTGITAAASAIVTVGAGHGFVAGDVVYFAGVVGMTQINGLTGTVNSVTSTTITLSINSSAFTAYTSGGTCTKYVQPSDIVAWSGQFDVPVRFDTDMMQMTQQSSQIRSLDTLPVIELTGG